MSHRRMRRRRKKNWPETVSFFRKREVGSTQSLQQSHMRNLSDANYKKCITTTPGLAVTLQAPASSASEFSNEQVDLIVVDFVIQ